jgi:regulator of PEP synthase PpsR (kinase-PPPase family)
MTAFQDLMRSAQRGRDAGIGTEAAFNRHVKEAAHNEFLVATAALDAAIAAAMAPLECAEPDPQAADTCNAVKAAKAAYDATLAAVDAAMADLEAAKAKCEPADAILIGDDPILRGVER